MGADYFERAMGALRGLLLFAEELKRANLSKLSFDREAWRAAATRAQSDPEPSSSTNERLSQALRRARNVMLRLGDAGDARLASYAIGRDPNSSADGKRFHSDLRTAQQVLRELEKLWGAAQPTVATDGPSPRR